MINSLSMVNVIVTVKKKERKKKNQNYLTFHILLLKIMSAGKNLSLSGPFFSCCVDIVSYVHIRF